MDGISSSFAVISLAFQLLDTVQKASGFVKDIQDAPRELLELSATLDQLHPILKEVHDYLKRKCSNSRLPGSPLAILGALERCERRIKPLDVIIHKIKGNMEQGNRARRTWASFKLVIKKEKFHELQTQLQDAMNDLSTAMVVNLCQLQ